MFGSNLGHKIFKRCTPVTVQPKKMPQILHLLNVDFYLIETNYIASF